MQENVRVVQSGAGTQRLPWSNLYPKVAFTQRLLIQTLKGVIHYEQTPSASPGGYIDSIYSVMIIE